MLQRPRVVPQLRRRQRLVAVRVYRTVQPLRGTRAVAEPFGVLEQVPGGLVVVFCVVPTAERSADVPARVEDVRIWGEPVSLRQSQHLVVVGEGVGPVVDAFPGERAAVEDPRFGSRVAAREFIRGVVGFQRPSEIFTIGGDGRVRLDPPQLLGLQLPQLSQGVQGGGEVLDLVRGH